MTVGKKLYNYYTNLNFNFILPDGIEVMNPYDSPEVREYVKQFYDKYYSDNKPRILAFGINPGRFGAGLTGINFTDPVALKEQCGIDNNLPQKKEISSDYIYRLIGAYGGLNKFYGEVILAALSPLGYTKNGINYNYYDDKKLQEAVTPFIINSIETHKEIAKAGDVAIVLGTGKNFKFIDNLNKQHNFFKQLIPLEHPRFIMQYKRKYLDEYINKYINTFGQVLS